MSFLLLRCGNLIKRTNGVKHSTKSIYRLDHPTHQLAAAVNKQLIRSIKTSQTLRGTSSWWIVCSIATATWSHSRYRFEFDKRTYEQVERDEAKRAARKAFFRRNWYWWTLLIAISLCMCIPVIKDSFFEECPLTKEQRVVIFSNTWLSRYMAEFAFKARLELQKEKILPKWHPLSQLTVATVNKLIQANLDIKGICSRKYTVTVIDLPEVNASVDLNGNIVVYSGLIQICGNVDSLACVLAHELSHVLMHHYSQSFIDVLKCSPVLLFINRCFALLPYRYAYGLSASAGLAFYLSFILPSSQKRETDADYLGMIMASKACVDVREGTAFFLKLDHLYDHPPAFLSTHPTNSRRYENFDQALPSFVKLREQCKCPPLPANDPVEFVRQKIEECEQRKKETRPPSEFFTTISSSNS